MTSYPPSERSRDALGHIRDNVRLARSFVAGAEFERFAADPRTAYAVVRCLEIISEASRRLESAVRTRHPDLPWKRIAAAGNVYRHAYDGIELDVVWRTVQDDLPVLLAAVEAELGTTS